MDLLEICTVFSPLIVAAEIWGFKLHILGPELMALTLFSF